MERTTTVLGPTGTGTTSTTKTSTPSLLGTWVVQGTSTTASVKPAASLPSALPDFSSCGNFRWEVTNQTATQVAGSFTADCADGVSVHGNITGQLGGATIPIVLSGELTRAGEGCPFSLTGTGTPIDAQTFHLTYSGTTCLGQMQGVEQPEPRAAFGADRIHDCRHDHRRHLGRCAAGDRGERQRSSGSKR